MEVKVKSTIVQSIRHLKEYPILYIDESSFTLFKKHIKSTCVYKDSHEQLLRLFDCFLGLTNQRITTLSLSSSNTISIFEGFIGALRDENFTGYSHITQEIYVNLFITVIISIKNDVPMLNANICIDNCDSKWNTFYLNFLKREYYQGWYVTGKQGKRKVFLKLNWVWNHLGPEVARKIHSSALDYMQRFSDRSLANYSPIVNGLLLFIEKERPDVSVFELSDTNYITSMFTGFCRWFFNGQNEDANCIDTAIKRWNDSVDCLGKIFIESGVFAKPLREIPYMPPKRKFGAETNIKKTHEGIEIKNKLITDVPIYLTDDEAIKLLFFQIDKDINTVLKWAEHNALSLWERFTKNNHQFHYKDFDLDSRNFAQKYGIKTKKKEKLSDLAYDLGMATSYALEPFLYLLIHQHPSITPIYLYGHQLYNRAGKLVGLEKTDAGTFLVGYKSRRGSALAQQKILLNERSEGYINQIIALTEPLRNYLYDKNDERYRWLLLSCGKAFSIPQEAKALVPNKFKIKNSFKERVKQFEDISDLTTDESFKLVSQLTMSRFRSTCALQIYLQTKSTKAMSEALGHAKYKPELLNHYLPETILQFFQSRWIRIFQKGIVCEAMKDSLYLLEASKFETMKELDEFLKNHMLKDLPDIDRVAEEELDNNTSIYISVEIDVLAALMSLEAAVSQATSKVCPKAIYWSEFSKNLISEIENDNYHEDLKYIVNEARKNINVRKMECFVYE